MKQENNHMTQPIETKSRPEYVETFREGPVAVNVFEVKKRNGKSYHYFNLSRSYKPDGKSDFLYSSNFYTRNATSIIKVVAEAAKKYDELSFLGPVTEDCDDRFDRKEKYRRQPNRDFFTGTCFCFSLVLVTIYNRIRESFGQSILESICGWTSPGTTGAN